MAAAGALLAGGASSALAATITGTANDPIFTAANGAVANNLVITVSLASDSIVFSADAGDVFSPTLPADCALDGVTGDVTCTPAAGLINSITANMDDGDDIVSATATAPMTVNGGLGNDQLTGASGADTLNGDGGDDTIDGAAGDDHLSGGDGDDQFTASAGADDVQGGANGPFDPLGVGGTGDVIHYGSDTVVSVSLDDVANDTNGANIHSDIESVFSDGLSSDELAGGAGANLIVGGAGNDVINARDGVADLVSCGDGTDTAFLDQGLDQIIDADPAACETVTFADPTPPGGGTTPPATTPPATTPPATTPPATTPPPPPPPPNTGASLLAPKSLSAKLSPSRDRSKPYKFTISGKLGLPAGVSKSKGCSGTVTITIKRGSKSTKKNVALGKDCSYKTKLSVSGKGNLKISAKFTGNKVLGTKKSATLSARAG